MDELTLDDLVNPVIEVEELVLLGKKAYVRKLSFDAQMRLFELFKGKEDEEAADDDIKLMLGAALCDKKGALLFKNPHDAVKVLGDIPDLMSAFSKLSDINSFDVEDEVKNLKADP